MPIPRQAQLVRRQRVVFVVRNERDGFLLLLLLAEQEVKQTNFFAPRPSDEFCLSRRIFLFIYIFYSPSHVFYDSRKYENSYIIISPRGIG